MADLISLSYAKTIARITGSTQDAYLTAVIAGCSDSARQFCRRDLSPKRYVDLYPGSGAGFLVLRNAPVISLENIILGPSTNSPQSYTNDAFDIVPQTGVIAFKPTEVIDTFYGYVTNFSFPLGQNSVQATYTAGFGYQVSIAVPITAGAVTVTPSAMYGVTNDRRWAVAINDVLTIDPGLATEEDVTVTGVAATTFTATFARNHAAAAIVLGSTLPSDIQMAVAQMVSNIYRRKDPTLQTERTGEYSWALRAGVADVELTPEIRAKLGHYRDVI